MHSVRKISKGYAYLIAGVLLGLSGIALCGVAAYFCLRTIYFCLQNGIEVGKACVIIAIATSAWFVLALSKLIYEIPNTGIIFHKEDGSIWCKYLVRGGEVNLAKIIDIKKYWVRRDNTYKIKFLDGKNATRNVMVSVKMKYSQVQMLWDILQPRK